MPNYKRAAYRRRLRRKINSAKRVAKLIFIIVLILGAIKLFAQIDRTNASEQPISPVREINVSSPTPTPTATPTPRPVTDEEMMKALPHGDLVWMTYGHESTWGKFDACRDKGLFNGFGYAQHKYGYQCFSSLEEVATKVSGWFDRHLQTMTVRQALCYYNKGIVMDDCDYAEYSLSL